jgi:hypothetical protein
MNKEELENKYYETLRIASKEVDVCLDKANQAIIEATEICEKYGVSLNIGLHYLGKQDYLPLSFKRKWPELSLEDIRCEDLQEGWQTSEICY